MQIMIYYFLDIFYICEKLWKYSLYLLSDSSTVLFTGHATHSDFRVYHIKWIALIDILSLKYLEVYSPIHETCDQLMNWTVEYFKLDIYQKQSIFIKYTLKFSNMPPLT